MKQLALAEQGRAFDLAYFILGEPSAAGRAALRACGQWRAQCVKVQKRKYFVPAHWRTKATPAETQILQLLVYRAAEVEEKAQEADGANLADKALIVRFIKHLVMLTTERNAFYVALGLGTLLYDYGYERAADVYDFLMRDAAGERIKGVEYFRKRKQVLLGEVASRFGKRVRWAIGPHGEKRWTARQNASVDAELVRQCLDAFTPWETSCVLPENDRKHDAPQSALRQPIAEQFIEVRGQHTLIHPACWARLAQLLKWDAPDTRLSLPQFFHPNDTKTSPPPDGRDEMLDDINQQLERDEKRRRACVPEIVALRVDGVERARWRLDTAQPVSFELCATERLVEVVTQDEAGELLLLSHLVLPRDVRPDVTPPTFTAHAGNYEFVLTFAPQFNDEGEYAGSQAVCVGRKRASFKAWWAAFSEGLSWPRRAWLYAATGLLLGSLLLGLWQWRKGGTEQLVARVEPPLPVATPIDDLRGTPSTNVLPRKIESVFIELPDAADLPARRVYEALTTALRAAGRLQIKDGPLDADVTVSLRVRRQGATWVTRVELSAKPPSQAVLLIESEGTDATATARRIVAELHQRGP